MEAIASRTTSDIIVQDLDAYGVPSICQYTHLNFKDPNKLVNESLKWLKELQNGIPIWNRLLHCNCVGQPRSEIPEGYEVEIPERLFSLWDNPGKQLQILKNERDVKSVQWMCNLLVFCAALRVNLDKWSSGMLNEIFDKASEEVLKQYDNNENFHYNRLNITLPWKDMNYQIQTQEVLKGHLYGSHNSKEFNLSRALMDFFKSYQFGILQCQQRQLAFGLAVGVDQGYFMYDCQSQGYPLFPHNQSSAYILRTKYLQILLYCLIVSFGADLEKAPFQILNVFVGVEDPLEGQLTKRVIEIYMKKQRKTQQNRSSIKEIKSTMSSNASRSSGGQEVLPMKSTNLTKTKSSNAPKFSTKISTFLAKLKMTNRSTQNQKGKTRKEPQNISKSELEALKHSKSSRKLIKIERKISDYQSDTSETLKPLHSARQVEVHTATKGRAVTKNPKAINTPKGKSKNYGKLLKKYCQENSTKKSPKSKTDTKSPITKASFQHKLNPNLQQKPMSLQGSPLNKLSPRRGSFPKTMSMEKSTFSRNKKIPTVVNMLDVTKPNLFGSKCYLVKK
ncbi:uncharacterized protein LOC109612033 [Musca domestica]|uniref:Uncharacterized protein LOC109612033 n=1 Tax=Musca domestica TaxID=7370 RepID=A0A9J7ICD0_MUSDO|nr:uncharacterized protein LOC109612033 [Musca domestica]